MGSHRGKFSVLSVPVVVRGALCSAALSIHFEPFDESELSYARRQTVDVRYRANEQQNLHYCYPLLLGVDRTIERPELSKRVFSIFFA